MRFNSQLYSTHRWGKFLILFSIDSCHYCYLITGAQNSGCQFNKKPLYRYSGCHLNDASALSIVLGQHFRHNSDRYSFYDDRDMFRVISADEAELEISLLVQNQTDKLNGVSKWSLWNISIFGPLFDLLNKHNTVIFLVIPILILVLRVAFQLQFFISLFVKFRCFKLSVIVTSNNCCYGNEASLFFNRFDS